jgi:hypothetical protein
MVPTVALTGADSESCETDEDHDAHYACGLWGRIVARLPMISGGLNLTRSASTENRIST